MPSRLRGLLLATLLALLGDRSAAAGEDRPRASGPAPAPEPQERVHKGALALVLLAVALVIAGAAGAVLQAKRSRETDALSSRLTQGNPKRGPRIALQYGCAGCHSIPGVRGPRGKVGPPLDDVGARLYLGGRLANTPDNLVQWIYNPREVDPKSAMPVTGISRREARDMAAYLLALR
jgi:cytochrome c2